MNRLRYPIGAVAKLTGVAPETLRAWERRYRAVEPSRDERGRVYSSEDVERLRLLRRLVDAGHAIGRVAPLPVAELRALLGEADPPPQTASVAPALSTLRDAVSRFDAPTFRRELSRLASVVPVRALCREVLLPLLHGVGDDWHAGRLDIAAEHLVSTEVRNLLGALARLRDGGGSGGEFVFATPEGELHDIPALAAAVVAMDAGFPALFLGASLPADEIVNAAARVRAPVVVLGWTGGPHEAPRQPLAAIVATARLLPSETELWVGGEGAREAADATSGRAVALETFDGYERALSRAHRR